MKCATTILFLCVAAVAQAQSISYNPTLIAWDKETDDPATVPPIVAYKLVLTDDRGVALPETTVPSTLREDDPCATPQGCWRLPWSAFPSLPVGRSYTVRLKACNVIGCSDVSNPAPTSVRVQPCVVENQVQVPALAIAGTVPALKVGQFATLSWTTTLVGQPRVLQVDLVGDGLPAWYVPVYQTTNPRQTVIGPFARAGTYALEATVSDEQGCSASLPFGTRLTVVP